MACIKNCNAPTIERNYLYLPNWELRYRTGWQGNYGLHGTNPSTQNFNAAFHSQLGAAMLVINSYASSYGNGNIQWVGHVGVKVCKAGCHSSGRAYDLTAIKFSNVKFDMNASWRNTQTLAQRRGYLAIWAGLRVYCKTILTYAYDAYHSDHIHIDNDGNGTSSPPAIRTYAKTDVALIQTACNLLNDAGLTIDGMWGSSTASAYNNLLAQFGMTCLSPTTNYWAARTLMILIMKHGFSSSSAGTYKYLYC